MDADLDPLLASRLSEELGRIPAPPPRPLRPPRSVGARSVIAVVAVVLFATVAGRELAMLRTPASPSSTARALYFGDPYGSGWLQIDPLTLADRGMKPLLDKKLSSNESVVTSADGSTIVVSHYGALLADHSVYDARTGALRWQFTDQEPMIVDGISANGQEIIGRAGSANHSLTDAKLIVSTVNGHIVRSVPAVEGCCVHAIAYDPSLASIYYTMGPSLAPDAPGRGPVSLLVQSTATGTVRTLSLPGIDAGRILSFGSPTVAPVPTLYFAATVLSPDGAKFAALSLDGASLVVVDTATLQVTQKTLIRQTSWRDLFAPLVAYGKESADNDSWSAAFSADGKTLFAYHTQSVQSGAPATVTLQTLVLERIDIERGAITAVAPNARPFTDYISDLVPSSDGQSVYVIQSGRLGIADRTDSPYLRRLDARSLAIQAERPVTDNAFDLREFQAPGPSAIPSATPMAQPSGDRILLRPNIAGQVRAGAPTLLNAVPQAGSFVMPYGGWRYDGVAGTLAPAGSSRALTEHPAPQGPLVAVERLAATPGGYLLASELAIRDANGAERVVYRAPVGFYWSGWSPDGRYAAVWEIDTFSGSIDLDGRPLVVIDAVRGDRVDLGKTLLNGTTAWTAPHTLAFVAGEFRMVWNAKTLRLWSPESGIRNVTGPETAALAPVWSADGHRLYFVSGPVGQYDPLPFFAGRGVGDRRLSVYDPATGSTRSLPHEPGFAEEGVRPSRDGTRLLVLRRRIVEASDVQSIPDAPLEVWLTDADGARGTALVRIPGSGFGYYGWYPGPSEWDWSQ